MVVGDDAQSIYSFRGRTSRTSSISRNVTARRRCTSWRQTTAAPRRSWTSRTTPSPSTSTSSKRTCGALKKSGVIPVVAPSRDVIQQAEFVAQRILELSDEASPRQDISPLPRPLSFDGSADGAHPPGRSPSRSEAEAQVLRNGLPWTHPRLLPARHVEPRRRGFMEADAQDLSPHRQEDRRPHLCLSQGTKRPLRSPHLGQDRGHLQRASGKRTSRCGRSSSAS